MWDAVTLAGRAAGLPSNGAEEPLALLAAAVWVGGWGWGELTRSGSCGRSLSQGPQFSVLLGRCW